MSYLFLSQSFVFCVWVHVKNMTKFIADKAQALFRIERHFFSSQSFVSSVGACPLDFIEHYRKSLQTSQIFVRRPEIETHLFLSHSFVFPSGFCIHIKNMTTVINATRFKTFSESSGTFYNRDYLFFCWRLSAWLHRALPNITTVIADICNKKLNSKATFWIRLPSGPILVSKTGTVGLIKRRVKALKSTIIGYQERRWLLKIAGRWPFKLESAKECVTTHRPKQLALKMDGAQPSRLYSASASREEVHPS